MANTLAPVGLSLHRGNTEGAAPTFGQAQGTFVSTNTSATFFGDPIQRLNTGYLSVWTAGTAVSQMAGIFVGCQYQVSGQGLVRSRYWPGSGNTGDITVFYVPCNLASGVPMFLVQAIGSTGILRADIGQNVDLSMGSGSTTTGTSAAGADQGTLNTTATLPFRVVDLGPAILPNGQSNDNTLANNWIVVAANVSGAGSTGI